jgi:hypothetical protein
MPEITRVQTGVRMEAALLKVLKALATYKNLGLGDLLEGICLHAFEGRAAFAPDTIEQIDHLKQIYGLTLTASDSHRLTEASKARPSRAGAKARNRPRHRS